MDVATACGTLLISTTCGILVDIIKEKCPKLDTPLEWFLGYTDRLWTDLEIFESWVSYCERQIKSGDHWRELNGKRMGRLILQTVPSPEVIERVKNRGFLSTSYYFSNTKANRRFCLEVLALLCNPEHVQNMHVEIFAQSKLPEYWKNPGTRSKTPEPN